jgi:glycosyltransferase
MSAPIAIFAFNRPDALQRMLNSLKSNPEYRESEKYFFIDGARTPDEQAVVNKVIEIARKESDNVCCNPANIGLGSNIIQGVTTVLSKHDRVIVLEDDLVLMPGFLRFMNEGLTAFEKDNRILSVCGYSLKIKVPEGYASSVYMGDRASSWGWATWRDRWTKVDWTVKDWPEFSHDKKAIIGFNRAGSDMFSMLKDYMEGRNRSWAIRFCYHQYRHNLWSVHPIQSLVDNEGFGLAATNCRQKYNRFKIEPAEKNSFAVSEKFEPVPYILKQLHKYHSIPIRIYSRIRKALNI